MFFLPEYKTLSKILLKTLLTYHNSIFKYKLRYSHKFVYKLFNNIINLISSGYYILFNLLGILLFLSLVQKPGRLFYFQKSS